MNGQATRRICVINDSPDFLEMMHALLEMEGYTVRVEHEIAARLDKIEEWQPALMVIDILTGRTLIGWELIHQIQQHPTRAAIPTIVCTAAACGSQAVAFSSTRAFQIGLQLIYALE